jgi:hypothetical protein
MLPLSITIRPNVINLVGGHGRSREHCATGTSSFRGYQLYWQELALDPRHIIAHTVRDRDCSYPLTQTPWTV